MGWADLVFVGFGLLVGVGESVSEALGSGFAAAGSASPESRTNTHQTASAMMITRASTSSRRNQ